MLPSSSPKRLSSSLFGLFCVVAVAVGTVTEVPSKES